MTEKANLIYGGDRICPKCRQRRKISEFSGGYCKDCRSEYNLKYKRDRHGEHIAKMELLLEHYGGCNICGETDPEKLNAFPTHGKGQEFAARFLIQSGFPDDGYLECKEPCTKDGLDI